MPEFEHLCSDSLRSVIENPILSPSGEVPGKNERRFAVAHPHRDRRVVRLLGKRYIARVENVDKHPIPEHNRLSLARQQAIDPVRAKCSLHSGKCAARSLRAGDKRDLHFIPTEDIDRTADMVKVGMGQDEYVDGPIPKRHHAREFSEHRAGRRPRVIEELVSVRRFDEHRVTLPHIKKRDRERTWLAGKEKDCEEYKVDQEKKTDDRKQRTTKTETGRGSAPHPLQPNGGRRNGQSARTHPDSSLGASSRYNDPMDIETIILTSSYLGIFGLMIANGALSFPSSQILYIIVGYFIGNGTLALLPSAFLGALGNTIGNVLLYEAVRAHGLAAIEKYGIFRKEAVKSVEIAFRKKGLWFLFVGKLLPAIKVFVPIPAALGKVHRGIFAGIMFVASFLWSLLFIAIGYFFGKSADVWQSYGIILAIVAGIIVFLFYRMLQAPEIQEEVARETALFEEQPKSSDSARE